MGYVGPRQRWGYKPPLGARLDRSHPLAQGLAFRYLFNEGQGLAAVDIAGGHTATLFNATWARGRAGYALSFNGSSAYLNCGAPPPTGTNRLSVACWFNPSTTSRSDLISCYNESTGTTNSQFDLIYGVAASAAPAFYVSSGSGVVGSGLGPALATGKWHQLVGTFDGATVSVYADGLLAAASASSLALNSTSLYNIYIGAGNTGSGGESEFADGVIDDVSIWSRALAAAEVASLYSDPYQMIAPSPLRRAYSIPASLLTQFNVGPKGVSFPSGPSIGQPGISFQ